MICPEFESLTPNERTEFIGGLVHAVQNSSAFFRLGTYIIRDAKKTGLFDNVIINPSKEEKGNAIS